LTEASATSSSPPELSERVARAYDLQLFLERPSLRAAIELAGSIDDERVLDLGTGTGALVRELARTGVRPAEAVGADASGAMPERAQGARNRTDVQGAYRGHLARPRERRTGPGTGRSRRRRIRRVVAPVGGRGRRRVDRQSQACCDCCPVLNFFVSTGNATRWLASHADVRGAVISIDEAIAAGRTVFADVLKEV
jgi:hypothetical protein